MSEPFLGQIIMVGFNFAPRNWAFCDGQILPINQNQSLYSLLGTNYGGDGRTSFGLPGLRGRTPIHVAGNAVPQHLLGSKGGEESHTLSAAQMPNHDHVAQATNSNAISTLPTSNVLAAANNQYRQPNALTQIHTGTIASVGGGQAHNNMQPYLALNFCIALQGLFPSRN